MFKKYDITLSLHLCFIACLFFICNLAFANGIVPPSAEELMQLIAAVGGLKGASALAIAAFAVQVVMYLLRSKLGEVAGKFRLIAVLLLTMVAGVIAQRIAGVELGAALVHANTLAAFQVLINQIWKQFFIKKD